MITQRRIRRYAPPEASGVSPNVPRLDLMYEKVGTRRVDNDVLLLLQKIITVCTADGRSKRGYGHATVDCEVRVRRSGSDRVHMSVSSSSRYSLAKSGQCSRAHVVGNEADGADSFDDINVSEMRGASRACGGYSRA